MTRVGEWDLCRDARAAHCIMRPPTLPPRTRRGRLTCLNATAVQMGKETTFAAVTMAGLVSAGAIVSLQRYVQVFYDKNGDKLASPGFSFTR